ncbi:MAG: 3-hydroxyacyl-CoA dehydrogenase (short-chain) [Actinomycetia bacterium]|nr:3-hydroxyacyl-CoA dehydrogenase (short-chain) [Actinomycetes bacterium]
MRFEGSVALVTGAASGLGAATARALSARGATVVVADLESQRERADGVLADLVTPGRFVAADLCDPDDVEALVVDAAAGGPLRVCVNCAGVGHVERVLDRSGGKHDLASFRRTIDINLVATFDVIRHAAAAMARVEPAPGGLRGVIVNTASIAAMDGPAGQVAYTASKAAVAGMTLALARDLGPVGVRVCAVAPGVFDTPMVATAPDDFVDQLRADVPSPSRLGRGDEFGALVVSIVENDYLNGEVIRLDGGLRMPRK